jgi:hypothetical protein
MQCARNADGRVISTLDVSKLTDPERPVRRRGTMVEEGHALITPWVQKWFRGQCQTSAADSYPDGIVRDSSETKLR